MLRLSITSLVCASVLLMGCRENSEPGNEFESATVQTASNAPTKSSAADEPPAPPPSRPPAEEPPEPTAGFSDQTAPSEFAVRFETTEGEIIVDVHRSWAPHGADRLYTLVREGYFTDIAFFRVVSGFMAQFGIHGDPSVARQWRGRNIQDDPVRQSNQRGMVTFAQTSAPNSRSTQLFINLVDNSNLDAMRFAPIGRVRDMSAVDQIHSGYGEGAPRGSGPAQARIQSEGNAYLRRDFPELDYIRSASIL